MRGSVVVLMMVLVMGARGGGQVSVEEARRRLAERQRERAAQSRPTQLGSATQPVGAATRGVEAGGDPDVQGALHEAWGKVMAKDYVGAGPMFSGPIAKHASNASALLGRAICEYELSNYKAAAGDAGKARQLSRSDPILGRQASLAAAAIDVATNQTLPALRLAVDCMKAEEKANMLDEDMQNVLGAALWRCKPELRSMVLVREAGKYYMAYDAKLAEHARTTVKSGSDAGPMRRWGTQWLPVDEANLKWNAYGNAVAARDKAAADFSKIKAARELAQMEYDSAHKIQNMRDTVNMALTEVDLARTTSAETAAREALANAQATLARTEAPPFPEKLEPAWSEPRSMAAPPATRPATQPGDY